MLFKRKSNRAKALARFDRLAQPVPSMNGYEKAIVQYQPTDESFVILMNGREVVLKSYNSYRKITEAKMRPYLHDLEHAAPGAIVHVGRAADGDLIGIFDVEDETR